MVGNLKLTQRETDGGTKTTGRKRQVYMKSDVEEKALDYCKKENVSMSMLIRMALEQYLGKLGY